MNEQRRQELIACYRDGLLTDTLPFWCQHGVDREAGGIMTSLDRDGRVVDTDKGVWQQGRFAWMMGELYNNTTDAQCVQRHEWLQLAIQTMEFIDRHGFDPVDGRMWFQLTCDGRPLRKRRYAYSESFAAIAYGELYQATGEVAYAHKAARVFQRFLDHNLHPPAAESKYTNTRPTRSIGFPMITIATAQELRKSINLESAQHWIDRSIDDIRRFHLKADIQCVMETVGLQGEMIEHFDGRTLNPGHAIEGAWFIMWEGKLRGDKELIHTGCQMLDWMWQRGWDSQYGGILYFVDVNGLPVQEYWHDMKFWWPQNETIIATLLAYQLTGDTKYAQWHTLAHEWAYRHFTDPQHGEWYGYLHRDGTVSSQLKGSLWKGPFHLPRMQWICWQLLLQGQA